MQALIPSVDGGFELASVPRPVPGPDEVLVLVSTAGVNPVDRELRDDPDALASVEQDAPLILGRDIAGVVVETGPGVSRFGVGDRVFGMPCSNGYGGGYAQFAVARAGELAHIPDAVSDTDAGALAVAGLAAWQAVVGTLEVREGDRVLVHAASGGVGHLAVQIAKRQGAEVWATAATRHHDVLRQLGADHLIDYRQSRFEDIVTAADAVLDLHGGDDYPARSVRCLRRGGQLLVPSPGLTPDAGLLADAGVTAGSVSVEPDHTILEELVELVATGALRIVVATARPLTDMAELHAIGRAGGTFGKLVALVPSQR